MHGQVPLHVPYVHQRILSPVLAMEWEYVAFGGGGASPGDVWIKLPVPLPGCIDK